MEEFTTAQKTSVAYLFLCKCPRCRMGEMFTFKNPWRLHDTLRMNEICPICGQSLDLEVGFYFGASYVSYGITVAISAVTCIAWWLLIGFSKNESSLMWWLISNATGMLLIQPYLMRLSRTGWLAFFVKYDPNWKTNTPKRPERTNREQQNNW